jgi:NADH-quinone oxidoreductase subunit J
MMTLQALITDAATPGSSSPWLILVPVILGLIAVYWLLPRPRRYPPLWGAALAASSLVLAGWFLIGSEATNAETLLFYAFSGIAVLSGGLLITQRNPVRGALSFALVVLSTCGLFLLQAAPFLMAATIIIYAGAIIVTFLFVIMLAQQAGLSDADQRSREPLLSCIAGFVLVAALLFVLRSGNGNLEPPADLPLSRFSQLSSDGSEPPRDAQGRAKLTGENVAYLGRTLFTDYLLAVELGGTLLLVATIGAIAIAGRRVEEQR